MLPIYTLLVDDSPSFLDAAERLLRSEPNIKVVGRAHSGNEAIEQVRQLQPDLVLMDWSMPQMNGLEATRQLKSQHDSPCIVLLTQHDLPHYQAAAAAAGADGFVTKEQAELQLLPLIKLLRAT